MVVQFFRADRGPRHKPESLDKVPKLEGFFYRVAGVGFGPSLRLQFDKHEYRIGEVAKVSFEAPFEGHAVLYGQTVRDGIEATVLRSEHLGDQTRLHLDLRGHAITTLTDPHQDYASSSTIKISPQNPLYFDANGARVA